MTSKQIRKASKIYKNGLECFSRQEYQQATQYLEEAVAQNPDNFRCHVYLGMAYFQMNEVDKSIACFQRAIELCPDYPKAYTNIGNAYRKKGALYKAAQAYEKALSLAPERISCRYNLGITYFDIMEYEKAAREFEAVLEVEPHNKELLNSLGNAYYRMQRYQEALDCFEKLMMATPSAHCTYANLIAKIQMINNDMHANSNGSSRPTSSKGETRLPDSPSVTASATVSQQQHSEEQPHSQKPDANEPSAATDRRPPCEALAASHVPPTPSKKRAARQPRSEQANGDEPSAATDRRPPCEALATSHAPPTPSKKRAARQPRSEQANGDEPSTATDRRPPCEALATSHAPPTPSKKRAARADHAEAPGTAMKIRKANKNAPAAASASPAGVANVLPTANRNKGSHSARPTLEESHAAGSQETATTVPYRDPSIGLLKAFSAQSTELLRGTMIEKIDHIGIAVRDLQTQVQLYRDILGLPLLHAEEVSGEKVKVACFQIGESRIELLQPTSDQSPVHKFLEKRGPGIHHIALRVRNIEQAIKQLREQGLSMIHPQPVQGAGGALIAFMHPKSTGKVLIELCQQPPTTTLPKQ